MSRPNLDFLALLDQFWQISKHEILLFLRKGCFARYEGQSFKRP